ncbi:peptide ABC transporter ATP-binding protein [Pseudomonas sp. BW16M2]|uniref:peptide ABC transporter ATP-binding protein n=1 Tax=Pseudomonas sp. BW16M2 TaxID=2745489 RepID=UPI0023524C62|nr:peptide ABC transporter ATP-binding protein [Pseudomonas sp. BW16M2]
MAVVLSARELTRHYEVSRGMFKGHALVRALNGVSFELEAGKTLAVVGESGCGKSTLARALTLIEEPSSGSLQIAGHEVKGASKDQRKQLRRDVQMVFQSPYASLNPRQKIGDQLAEPLLINTSLSKTERREKVQKMMEQVGLRPEHYQRYPHMFSGGQRQRIALARAMMLQPKVLVADEPTSALDVSIQAQVLNLFMDLQKEFNTAYVFISHNLAVVRHVADQVLVMYLGRPAEMGPKEDIYEKPLHPYTQALLSATPAIHPDPLKPKIRIAGELPNPLNPPDGCAFHKRCPHATERCAKEVPALRQVSTRQVACPAIASMHEEPDQDDHRNRHPNHPQQYRAHGRSPRSVLNKGGAAPMPAVSKNYIHTNQALSR